MLYIAVLFILILPVTSTAMPPHPKLIDEWNKQGILKEKINDYHERSDTLKIKSLKAGTLPKKSFPTGGTSKVCVLLVQYSDADMAGVSTPAFYTNLFNGTTSPTLEKYFYNMSDSKLNIQFEVHGPYTVSRTHDYYGTDTAGFNFPGLFRNIKPPAFQYLLIIPTSGFVIAVMLFCSRKKEKKIWSAAILILLIPVFFIHLYGCKSESTTSKEGIPVEGNDAHPAALVIEAIRKADDAGVNFSQYNNSCIIIIHQGTGQEASGESTDIWSHQWDLASAKYYGDGTGPVTVDGVTLNVYTVQPEFTYNPGDSSIGVFAHELGHVLGLPDLYDTNYETLGVGDWSLMAGGSWCGPGSDGSRPAPLLAWEKYKIGGTGWLTITPITVDQLNVTTNDIESSHTAYKIILNSFTGQYLLLEGKKQSAPDEWTVPGSGILVTHIHEGIISSYTSSDTVNTGYNRVHGVNIVEADGSNNLWEMTNSGDASDLFYSGHNDELSTTSNPDTKYYTSELVNSKTGDSQVRIYGISSNIFPMNFDIDFL